MNRLVAQLVHILPRHGFKHRFLTHNFHCSSITARIRRAGFFTGVGNYLAEFNEDKPTTTHKYAKKRISIRMANALISQIRTSVDRIQVHTDTQITQSGIMAPGRHRGNQVADRNGSPQSSALSSRHGRVS